MGAIRGIDWASEWHDVHIADQLGDVLCTERFAHDERGIDALIELYCARARSSSAQSSARMGCW